MIFKYLRRYQVAVIDNSIFSYTYVKHGSWPVVLVINPKAVGTIHPSKETTSLIFSSTHILILILTTFNQINSSLK